MTEHTDDATVQGDDVIETTPQYRETMTEHRDDATVQGDDDRAQRRHHNSKRITEHRDVAIVQA